MEHYNVTKRALAAIALLMLGGCGDTVNNYYTTTGGAFTNVTSTPVQMIISSNSLVPIGSTKLYPDLTVVTDVAAAAPEIPENTVCTSAMNGVFDLYSTPASPSAYDDVDGMHSRDWSYPGQGFGYSFVWFALDKTCHVSVSSFPPY